MAVTMIVACKGEPVEQAVAAEPTATPSASAYVSPALAEEVARQKRIHQAACKPDETPIFTCTFADGKRVAVCGAGEWLGYYRFGGATPELELSGGKYANAMYSGGGEDQIAFDNGDTRYIVFSRMVRTGWDDEGHNVPAISDGVVIERAGKFAAIRLCHDPDVLPVQTGAANAVWEDERELFTDETIRADPTDHE
ncbi:hypothetical protein BG023_112421 [Porphyrobacter sp. LM 6]|nr:hypothetical protein BG023_112421 [Porphyrobacter sp. LM 6]